MEQSGKRFIHRKCPLANSLIALFGSGHRYRSALQRSGGHLPIRALLNYSSSLHNLVSIYSWRFVLEIRFVLKKKIMQETVLLIFIVCYLTKVRLL